MEKNSWRELNIETLKLQSVCTCGRSDLSLGDSLKPFDIFGYLVATTKTRLTIRKHVWQQKHQAFLASGNLVSRLQNCVCNLRHAQCCKQNDPIKVFKNYRFDCTMNQIKLPLCFESRHLLYFKYIYSCDMSNVACIENAFHWAKTIDAYNFCQISLLSSRCRFGKRAPSDSVQCRVLPNGNPLCHSRYRQFCFVF